MVPLRVSEELPEFDESVLYLQGEDGTVALTQDGPIDVLRNIPEFVLVRWMRHQLFERPKWCANVCGIEQLGYLDQIKKPEPSPTLAEVGELFQGKDLQRNWKDKCKAFWQEFTDIVGVTTLREITQDKVIDYADYVEAYRREGDERNPEGYSATYVRQRYEAVKSIINYPPKRGKWAEDCTRVYALTKVLQKPEQNAANPSPIDPAHFSELLDHADPTMSDSLSSGLLMDDIVCR